MLSSSDRKKRNLATHARGVRSYLNLGGQVILSGHNLPPLVKIGLTNLPIPGWAIAHPAHPSPTPLHAPYKNDFVLQLSHNMKNKKSG